jgi:NhaP-type Na+/H+ or K+/H+ antiporter
VTEFAVVISLFTAGLKLRLAGSDRRWQAPILLAALAMVLTVGGIAAVAVPTLGLSLGAAVLLGALLAPTDPVLASDVQVSHEHDAEPVRFSLTGEAGLNDGTAFPFVMLGLGLMGAHEIGAYGWRWFAVDLVWAVAAGLGVGTVCGAGIGKLVIYLRRVHREAVGLDEFLALGLIALSYGIALLVHAYGFLAVFAAGLSVRRIERQHSEVTAPADVEHAAASTEEQATNPDTAPAYMAHAVLGFNEQLERLGELVVVLVVGAMLSDIEAASAGIWFALSLFVVIRPVATLLALVRVPLSRPQRAFIAWFGVRGIGSIYYLAYALSHGASASAGRLLVDVTLVVVAASIVVHGISVTPLMQRYSAFIGERQLR